MLILHGGRACLQETFIYHRHIGEETGKHFSLTWTLLCSKSIVVEDLIGILQDCVDDPNLPTSVRHIRACAHKCGPMENVKLCSLRGVS